MHNVMLEENGSLELSEQWLEFLSGGNRAFNFMLILGISSKCVLKTSWAPDHSCVWGCVPCMCACVSNKEQVAWAVSSPHLNPAASFLYQLIPRATLSPPPSVIIISVSFCFPVRSKSSMSASQNPALVLFCCLPSFIHLPISLFSLSLPLVPAVSRPDCS